MGSNSGHGGSRSGRLPLLTNSTDETPRSSLSSEERSRRDERRATRPPACIDGGLSSVEILKQIQNFFQRQEAFNAKIEEQPLLLLTEKGEQGGYPKLLRLAFICNVSDL